MSAAEFNRVAWQFHHSPSAKTAWHVLSAIDDRLMARDLDCCQRMQLRVLAHGLLRCYGPDATAS